MRDKRDAVGHRAPRRIGVQRLFTNQRIGVAPSQEILGREQPSEARSLWVGRSGGRSQKSCIQRSAVCCPGQNRQQRGAQSLLRPSLSACGRRTFQLFLWENFEPKSRRGLGVILVQSSHCRVGTERGREGPPGGVVLCACRRGQEYGVWTEPQPAAGREGSGSLSRSGLGSAPAFWNQKLKGNKAAFSG